jgi:hypothetical protein
MRFRFRKSIRIAPGIRLNIGSRGVSTTIGPRGASVNVGPRGTYANLGIPGTGLSARTRLDGEPGGPVPPRARSSNGSRHGWVIVLLVGIVIGLMLAALR